ncbi:MAG TPA: hypothetical protein VFD30_02610 [Terriglobia bacterium]|jgi:hypothetical protein|nr:hypothetical protein [Terriglobia bacterium]
MNHSRKGSFQPDKDSSRRGGERESTVQSITGNLGRYRSMVENSWALFGTQGAEGKILSADWAMAALCAAAAPEEELVGRKASAFLAPDSRHLFDSWFDLILKTGSAHGIMNTMGPGGKERLIEYKDFLHDESGVKPVVRCCGLDVSEQNAPSERAAF